MLALVGSANERAYCVIKYRDDKRADDRSDKNTALREFAYLLHLLEQAVAGNCGLGDKRYGAQVLAVIPLVTKSDVEGSRLLKQMEEIREFSQSRVFIATVVSAVVITLLYYAIRAFIRASKQKKHGRYYL